MSDFQPDYGAWPTYVPVAERRRKAARKVATLRKQGRPISPVAPAGMTIATTFWGRAWCNNLESYSDLRNRLERGRSYLRNGAVVDLQIAMGKVTALVMGSELYRTKISIKPLAASRWQALIKECAGKIDSLIELLQGRFSRGVMEVLTRQHHGLFPEPQQIRFTCSCPDPALMCKHIAATLYGVGARLDHEPELLFRLRRVDQLDLITGANAGKRLGGKTATAQNKELDGQDLSALFGIELDSGAAEKTKTKKPVATRSARPQKAVLHAQVTRKELRALGIGVETIQTWRRNKLLLPTGERGAYATTPLVRRWLARWEQK